MEEIKSIGLVGLGAIGMVAAPRFFEVVPERFRVIADPARQERYRRQGISFNGKRYDDFRFADPTADGPMDLILIATKASGLEAALDQIEPFVGPSTTILSLLNGITSEEIVASRYGADKVLYSLFLGVTSTRVGNQVTMTDGKYHFHFGEELNPPEGLSHRVQRIRNLFEKVGISYKIPENMLTALWQKWVINVGMNQANVLLRAPYGHLKSNPRARELVIRLMDETVAVARAAGIPGAEEMLAGGIRVLDRLVPEDKSSMLQDVEAGRPTEVDLFAGELCRLGAKYGIPVPMNAAARTIIEALF